MQKTVRYFVLALSVVSLFFIIGINGVAAYTRQKTYELVELRDSRYQAFILGMANKEQTKNLAEKTWLNHIIPMSPTDKLLNGDKQ